MGDLSLGAAAMTAVRTERRGAGPAGEVAATHRPDTPAAGALFAVCGLCGGAGASTLAYLVARGAARSSPRPVLVCDTGGPTGGLAAYAGVESPRSLPQVAEALAAGDPLADGLFVDAGPGLRLLARGPDAGGTNDAPAAARLLHDAREAHSLTVVDCGTPAGPLDRQVLREATHVAWVVPATASGVRRGERLLATVMPGSPRRELVVARHDAAGRTPPMGELATLAAARGGPLVLMPHVPDLAERPPEEVSDAAGVTLGAIEGVLRR